MRAVRVRAENVKVDDVLNGQRVKQVVVDKGRKGLVTGVVLKHPKNRTFEIRNLQGIVNINRPKKNFGSK